VGTVQAASRARIKKTPALKGARKNEEKSAGSPNKTRAAVLFEITGSAFNSFALVAFGDILHLSVFKHGFHHHFTAAIAAKFLGRHGGTGVLAYSHKNLQNKLSQ
jgi:hypothetical protein